ncbi:MAG TPA: TerB N-terminal domain-containing protein [Pararobbsia sp.]|nr:TerB N-terminal domain-containing protein [Pararobbsia sp.]
MSTTAQAPHVSPTPGAPACSDGARWVAPGERVVVGGTTIDGGLFYLDDSADRPLHPLDSCVVATAHDIAEHHGMRPPRGAAGTEHGIRPGPHAGAHIDADAEFDPHADARASSVSRAVTESETSEDSSGIATDDGPAASWLSYAALTPAQRRTYVEWLASERHRADVHVGYLNLYLYGLERRVLIDGSRGELADDEYDTISSELRRLLKLSQDWSFQTHVENLIESVTVLRVAPGRLYLEAPRVRATRGYQVPFTVRVAFGQAAVDNAPVPAEWAFAWASLDSAITRKPPLSRVAEPFRLLFQKLYRARLRDGMRVAPNRTRLKFPDTAFPALRELDVPESVGIIPDLSAVTTPRGRLQFLVNECADALGAYGRYLARNPGADGTLDAALILAPDLWPEALRRQIDALAATTRERIEVMRFSDLLAAFKGSASLSRERVVTFVSVLGQAGVGVEPDVRTGARTPRPDDCIALFGIDPATRIIDEDCAYLTAALMIDVAATLAMADGQATHPELTLMHHHIEHAMRLSEAQQQRLKARVAVQISAPQSLASLKKRLEPLSADERHVLAAFLVKTANADGVVTPEEVRLLEKIYRMLELDTQQLYSDLHHDAATPARRAPKAGAVSRATQPRQANGADRPGLRAAEPNAHAPLAFELDPARISALQNETAQVSTLLAHVFAQDASDDRGDDDVSSMAAQGHASRLAAADAEANADADVEAEAEAAEHASLPARNERDESIGSDIARASAMHAQPSLSDNAHRGAGSATHRLPSATQASDAGATLLGLDDAHSTFLRLLVSRPSWTRQELAVAAADLELMLDGAMEQVNEASLDHWDEPLTDGDDPVEINQELAQRLAA